MAKRKLIEAAIPLDAINAACKADKDRKTGTIRNLHKWFAPMPLPAWRALLFATLVDDPEDESERDRLMMLIEALVESGGDLPAPDVVADARSAMARCWPDGLPTVLDPFCGGGSTLIEAQRLGCPTIGSDLNPVPVLMTKVLTELVPRAAQTEPVSDLALRVEGGEIEALVADIKHYGGVVRQEAWAEVAHLFAGQDNAIAWLWCRTVTCANPACRAWAPLVDSCWLSKKTGAEASFEIRFEPDAGDATFEVIEGPPTRSNGTVVRTGGSCAKCEMPLSFEHIRREGRERRLGLRLMVVVEQRGRERLYRAATPAEEAMAKSATAPADAPDVPIDPAGAGIRTPPYGLTTQADLYTNRQLVVLDAFSRAVSRIHQRVESDGGSDERAQAITAVLGLCVGKLAQHLSTQVRWFSRAAASKATSAFGRNDLPMSWDFAECNVVGGSVGDWTQIVETAVRAFDFVPPGVGIAEQRDARSAAALTDEPLLVATDPPYFDQIGYADLADYFYVWLRKALRQEFPDLFQTRATPKSEELVALPGRHGGKDAARQRFVDGFRATFASLREAQHPAAPMLVVYAFKEQDAGLDGSISPGWEAILDAIIGAEMTITATWPIHATGSARMRGVGSNALATYVLLACRPRSAATRVTRNELTRALRTKLVAAVAELQHANVAPVDLAQAVIGPGMEVYSRHAAVVETDGSRMRVRAALALINRVLAEVLDEQEGDLDPDSRWAVTWYDDHGFDTAAFGKADQLARAKGIAVNSLVEAGIVTSGAGKVAVIARDALRDGWDPATDRRATAWEAVQYLVRSLADGGERAAAELYARLGALADPARELAYRLFTIAEKKGRIDEAIAYNGLVTSWSEIARLADDLPRQATATTESLF